MAAPTAQKVNTVSGLSAFVRDHLTVVNGLILASGSVVASLDLLAPRVSILPSSLRIYHDHIAAVADGVRVAAHQRCFDRTSVVITTNLGFAEWAQVFGKPR